MSKLSYSVRVCWPSHVGGLCGSWDTLTLNVNTYIVTQQFNSSEYFQQKCMHVGIKTQVPESSELNYSQPTMETTQMLISKGLPPSEHVNNIH